MRQNISWSGARLQTRARRYKVKEVGSRDPKVKAAVSEATAGIPAGWWKIVILPKAETETI
jgi:hypothetical protein